MSDYTSFDWTQSGIKNTFRFEAVDSKDPAIHICDLEGVTGGKLTQSYRGDYRSSASLDLDGTEIPNHCAIRIHHTASAGNQQPVENILATLVPQPPSRTLTRGRITGTVELYSAMKSLDGDLVTANSIIPVQAKNQSTGKYEPVIAWKKFKSIVNNSGQPARIDSGIQSANVTMKSAWTWEHGKSALTAAQKMADICSGYIEIDNEGYVCLIPYENPSNRTTGGTISTGINSLILLGVTLSQGDICNKVLCSYEKSSGDTKKTYSKQAVLDPTHPWSFQNIGRWCAEEIQAPSTIDDDTVEEDINKLLEKEVKKSLNSKASYKRTFGVNMLYTPSVDVGNAMRLHYQDSANGEVIDANVFISQRDITLDASMQMELTCEERWTNTGDTLAVS